MPEEIVETKEPKEELQFCKIRIPGEGLWGILRGKTENGNRLAEVNNTPLDSTYFSLGDIVEINEGGQFIKVHKRTSRSVIVAYDGSGTDKEIRERYKQLVDFLRGKEFGTEGFVAGYVGVSIPLEMKLREFDKILKESPVPAKRGK